MMKTSVTILLFGLLIATGAGVFSARAEDEAPDGLEVRLLKHRVDAQQQLMGRLFDLLGDYAETLEEAQKAEGVGASILERRVRQLQGALDAKRKKPAAAEGDPEGQNPAAAEEDAARRMLEENLHLLGQNLMAEQRSHTEDVVHLQQELAKAYERAERYRLEMAQALQKLAEQIEKK